jgi:hypothetical protein
MIAICAAFRVFAEGGLYKRPIPWGFNLDAYAQAGVVGLGERDFFADGALAFTRPVCGRFSAGRGVWGGYQPGLYRLDAGSRVSMRVPPTSAPTSTGDSAWSAMPSRDPIRP